MAAGTPETITVNVTGFNNYNPMNIVVTVNVTDRLVVEIDNVTVTSRAYNGSPIAPSGTPRVRLEGTTTDVTSLITLPLVYTYSGTGIATTTTTPPTNVGTYTLVISTAATEPAHMGESDPINFSITRATPAAPDAPTFASSTQNSITINTVSGQQYAISTTNSATGVTWTTVSAATHTFPGLNPNTQYFIFTRLAENPPNQYASLPSAALQARTSFAPTITSAAYTTVAASTGGTFQKSRRPAHRLRLLRSAAHRQQA